MWAQSSRKEFLDHQDESCLGLSICTFWVPVPMGSFLFGTQLGFPGSSAGEESACNAGDPGSIPGLGRSSGEGIGYPFQYLGLPCGSDGKEFACNAGSLGLIPGLGRSPGGSMETHSSILAWRIPMDGGAWWATVRGVGKSQTRLSS